MTTATDGGIDRIAPTLRPGGKPVMRQDWHDLLFLHWKVPQETIQRTLPPGLTVDSFEGDAYIGLVPFRMTGVRPMWSPSVPGISDFLEINVRTYVHAQGKGPGVWFYSLDASNPIPVAIARALFKLPYFFAEMRQVEEFGVISYRNQRLFPGPVPAVCDFIYHPIGDVTPAVPGTLAHFLCERYFLYSKDGTALYRGQVHHTSYPLQSAVVTRLEENLVSASGVKRPLTDPLIHFAREVNVEIFPLEQVALIFS